MRETAQTAQAVRAEAAACAEHARATCLRTGPPRRVGIELEWLVRDVRHPSLPADEARVAAAAERFAPGGVFPHGSALSREPGGQLELSSPPYESLAACVAGVRADLRAMREELAAAGHRLSGYGIDPWREPARVFVDRPRYACMERLFDRFGPFGRYMMGASASVQVCLDAGTQEPGPYNVRRRWWLAHRLGPVLVAAFANSPMAAGRPTGWRSTRQVIWARLDPSRTAAPAVPMGTDPRDAWARYALAARLMCVRDQDGGPWASPHTTTFGQWIDRGYHGTGAASRPPTMDDFAYHLTTLFPPVRPQGHLELRMIDAQRGEDGWIVPLVVTTALFEDPEATRAAEDAVADLPPSGGSGPAAPADPLWLRACRLGPHDPALGRAALRCFDAALAALPRLGVPELRPLVDGFTQRYVARGRCPADDLTLAARRGPRSWWDGTGEVPEWLTA
ncbi:ergothioneine biosynthesis glutamate--cysteine ligase EgtA [Streptomyces sp. HPF1205]|uniref:ergothioneine biosynthesis glutamate--cysteine ligase EgtA n=1 Tax=Streptomyces sp. HPF1205 TaxID=2873262 RepID=UPI001CED98DA|nr:ergothioneine biosynthesis glutamate--cysteine ligase EgtA [Streptomyces sp. HPF1205]